MGCDIGKKRIGLALSDPLGMFASGLTTIDGAHHTKAIETIVDLCRQHDVNTLVIGLPIKTTGEPSELSELAQRFGEALQTHGFTVVYQDERFTSKIAQQSLQAQGVKSSKNKGLVDKTAAALILQSYLDTQARQSSL